MTAREFLLGKFKVLTALALFVVAEEEKNDEVEEEISFVGGCLQYLSAMTGLIVPSGKLVTGGGGLRISHIGESC